MFNFFKKVTVEDNKDVELDFDLELIGCALAYEIALSDGKIDSSELNKIKDISNKILETKQSSIVTRSSCLFINNYFYNYHERKVHTLCVVLLALQ